jgi:hypothetical protein
MNEFLNKTGSALDDALSSGECRTSTGRALKTVAATGHDVSNKLGDIAARKRSFIERLFPTETDKILNDNQVKLARNECELTQRLHAIACAARYEACHEAADAWIKGLRLETRGALSTFAAEKVEALRISIEQRRQNFAAYIAERYVTAERYHNISAIYNRYLASIETELAGEFEWLDTVVTKYRSAVAEGLEQYGKRALASH